MIAHALDDALWHTSSYSGGHNQNCVEVGVVWRMSSHSGGQSQNCVEVGQSPATVGVRDTKRRAGGALAVSPDVWRAFVRAVTARG